MPVRFRLLALTAGAAALMAPLLGFAAPAQAATAGDGGHGPASGPGRAPSQSDSTTFAGYQATVYNRTRSKAKPLVDRGAAEGGSPKAVAESSDVVFTIVGFPRDVREVTLASLRRSVRDLSTKGRPLVSFGGALRSPEDRFDAIRRDAVAELRDFLP